MRLLRMRYRHPEGYADFHPTANIIFKAAGCFATNAMRKLYTHKSEDETIVFLDEMSGLIRRSRE